jgi:hypothetical protein
VSREQIARHGARRRRCFFMGCERLFSSEDAGDECGGGGVPELDVEAILRECDEGHASGQAASATAADADGLRAIVVRD